jgi:hypothetical protein
MRSSSTGSGVQALVGLIIGILALIARGTEGPGVMVLIALALVWYGYLSQVYANGSPPSNDEPFDADIVTIKQFVPPRSLVVVPFRETETEMIDIVIWVPTLREWTPRLSPEQIVGRLARSRKDGGTLEPANFVEHEYFVQFLHRFLKRELPGRPSLQGEGSRIQDGWVAYVDSRVLDAPKPASGGEPDDVDVIGRLRVQGGLIDPGSYERNRAHRLLTEKGLFQLEFALRERLQREIIALHAFREAGEVTSGHVM